MIKNFFLNPTLYALISVLLLSSCATIIGGSKYNAKVHVPKHSDATIFFNGEEVGKGEASLKVKRKDAGNLSFTISKDGCDPETKTFNKRKFRGWAFTGSLISFTGLVGPIPLPWGVAVDGATGAWWKPDISEIGVTKQDYNHYIYTLNFSNCSNNVSEQLAIKSQNTEKSYVEKLRELKRLLDEGIITKDEFEKLKSEILVQE